LGSWNIGEISPRDYNYANESNMDFPVEVGIKIGKINKVGRKEGNSRNSHLGHKHAENSCCPRIRPA